MPRAQREARASGPWTAASRSTPPSRPSRTTTASTSRARIDHPVRPRGLRRRSTRPTSRQRFRWWGLYTQRRPGIDGGRTGALEDADIEDRYFMMRVRIPGGQLDAEQLRAIGEVAEEFGRDVADVTDRQNVQYHWIRIEDVPAIWEPARVRRPVHAGRRAATPRATSSAARWRASTPTRSSTPPACCEATEAVARAAHRAFTNLPRKWKTAISGCTSHCTVARDQRRLVRRRPRPRRRDGLRPVGRRRALDQPDDRPAARRLRRARTGCRRCGRGVTGAVPRLRLPAAAQPGAAEVPRGGLGAGAVPRGAREGVPRRRAARRPRSAAAGGRVARPRRRAPAGRRPVLRRRRAAGRADVGRAARRGRRPRARRTARGGSGRRSSRSC